MQLLAVNVGLPQDLTWQDITIKTAIVKNTVAGPVMVRKLNLEGDGQADLRVHGGETKAVYGYGAQHYEFWQSELSRPMLPWGSFGENLTIEGLDENDIQIGDQFRIGEAILMAREPRKPCNTLAIRLQQADIIERFLFSMRSGVYFSVVQEGKVQAGDVVEKIHCESHGITVSDVIRLDIVDREDEEGLHRASQITLLPEKWRNRFRQRLEGLKSRPKI